MMGTLVVKGLIRKNLQCLYADPETKRVFTPAPFVFFRSARNLKSFLKRSKVYPLERKVSSSKCNGKRCQVCLSINETDTFGSFQTKQKCNINHYLNCNDKCLIYLLFCKVCGLQYVGSTTDKFHFRQNKTLFLAIKMCTGFITDGLCMKTMCACHQRTISEQQRR